MKNSKVLALKYRPKNFNDLIGQEIVAQTVFNSINSEKIPNAFLFHGIRGTGKTSIARIIAKALNCENGVLNLCETNLCSNCEAISNSSHLDVIEQDCATATGIDSVRDLIEFCRYPPASAKFKVLILDEIQAMSKAGAQSLLKILEEPPSYVKFIFCTTEIKKILVTMLSRCTRFDLSRVKFDQLFNYIKKIKDIEKGNISDDALRLICKCSEGSVRDALSLLDRAMLSSSKEKELNLEKAQNIFGHFDKSQLILVLKYILEGNEKKVLKLYRSIFDGGIDPSTFLNDFLEILYYVKNIETIKISGTNFDLNDEEYKNISLLANNIDFKTLILYWQFTLKAIEELNIVSNQNITIEMFLLRLIYLSDYSYNNHDKTELEKEVNYKFEEEKEIINNSSISSQTVNQIKNIDQKDKIELKNSDISENLKIKSFNNLLDICNKKKEMSLKYELETHVNLVSFQENKIEISFNERLSNDFIKILSSKLLEWTGERWIIALSQQTGQSSLKEHKKKEKDKLIKDFKKTAEYAKIINYIDDAKLNNIEDIKKDHE